MDSSVGNEQDFPGPERHRRPALDRILEHALENVDDFLARMAVVGSNFAGSELDKGLNHLASRNAEIMPLEVGAFAPSLLGQRELSSKAGYQASSEPNLHGSRIHLYLPKRQWSPICRLRCGGRNSGRGWLLRPVL